MLQVLLVVCLLSISDLYSATLDLFHEEQIWVDQETSLKLHHFRENSIYILHFEGKIELVDEYDFITVKDNTILIENDNQLGEEDVLTLIVTPHQPGAQLTVRVIETDRYPNLGNEKWGKFIDETRERTKPGAVTQQLAKMTQSQPLKHLLTVGCGSGRETLFWAENGAEVTILDGTPHAVAITGFRLAEKGYFSKLKGALAARLEAIPDDLGLFEAVTGSAVFPFIPPDQFKDVMTRNILAHVAPSGYFAGDFFGKEHGWADRDSMTFITIEELSELFAEQGFEIVWFEEIKEVMPTVFDGLLPWHEIRVIAKRNSL